MYQALWRILPGGTVLKVVQSLALAAIVVFALFGWVFPWAEAHVPFLEVTVEQ